MFNMGLCKTEMKLDMKKGELLFISVWLERRIWRNVMLQFCWGRIGIGFVDEH